MRVWRVRHVARGERSPLACAIVTPSADTWRPTVKKHQDGPAVSPSAKGGGSLLYAFLMRMSWRRIIRQRRDDGTIASDMHERGLRRRRVR